MIREISVAAVLASSSAAYADVSAWSIADKVADTRTYYVEIFGAGYSQFINEEALQFTCDKTGAVSLSWRVGGRYSGVTYMSFPAGFVQSGDVEISFRIDGGPPVDTTIVRLNSPAELRQFFNALTTAKAIDWKRSWANSSTRFDLTGFARVVGPDSGFGKQCASALGYFLTGK